MTPERRKEIAELRSRITPGPWSTSDRCYDWLHSDGWLIIATITDEDNDELDVAIAGVYERSSQNPNEPTAKRASANAAFLAAAPQIVDEQNAEIDRLSVAYYFEQGRVKQLESESVVSGERLAISQAEIDRLTAENARLREALIDMLEGPEVISDSSKWLGFRTDWSRIYDRARSALAQSDQTGDGE